MALSRSEIEKRYYRKNREKKLQYHRDNKAKFAAMQYLKYEKLKNEAFEQYSDGFICCSRCGESDPDVLTLDHINNDGADYRNGRRAGMNLYYWLKKDGWPEGLQILCFNCNIKKERMRQRAKRMENAEYRNHYAAL